MSDWRDAVRKRVQRLNLDGSHESEIVEEIAGDLEQRYEDLLRAGSSPQEAQRAVLKELDDLPRLNRPVAIEPAGIGTSRKGNLMSSFLHDLKVAFRMLRTKPGFAAMVIGMLALGIAGNTAIFSIFNTLMLRPLPFPAATQLIDVDETAPKWNLHFVGINNPDYFGWRDANSTFTSLAAYGGAGGNLSDSSGVLQRVTLASVTANFLDTLGLSPVLGRNFSADEDRPKGPKVVLLGYDLWQSLYHGDRDVVGRVVKISESPYTIVGVLPREAIWPTGTDAWIPLGADPNQSGNYYLNGVGRLKPGVSIDQARADLLRVHKNVQERTHDTSPTSPILTPLRDRALGDLKTVTAILFSAVAVVLIIACVNIAGLMLVRGEARSREIAIRAAIGASRAAIVRQLLTESLLLAVAGAVVGILAGKASLKALIAMIPTDVPRWLTFDMDWRFAIFAVVVTGAATLLFGLVPAIQTAAADARGCMQETARSTVTRAKGRVLGALAVCEIALAVVLLAGAGLVIEAFQKALHVDPGFRPEGALTWNMRLAPTKFPKPEQWYAFYSTLLDRVREIPGVKSAAAASQIPLTGHSGYFFEGEGSPHGAEETKPVTLRVTAMPGYFETMGVTFIAGRPFDPRDEAPDAPKVAIVNESFAKYYWPGQNAVGKRIRHPGPQPDWFQVVGLTKDTKHYGLDQEMKPSVFVPFRVGPSNGMYTVVRTGTEPDSLIAPIREVIRKLDPDLPAFDVRSMSSRVDRSLWTRRVYSWLFGVFAAVAVLLAAAGIYGVISFSVSLRTREIGIRMAFGARPEQVMAGVLKTGMLLVAMGIILGVVASQLTSRLLQSLLFGIGTREILTYTVVVLAVAVIGAAANYLPARRAAGVDPIRALRAE
jgi:predicted permease